MRPYFMLLGLAVVLSFLSGNYLYKILGGPRGTRDDQERIQRTLAKFARAVRPEFTLDLSELYDGPGKRALTRPRLRLDQDAEQVYSGGTRCFSSMGQSFQLISWEKAVVWEEFRCGLRGGLPGNFFELPPFLHPSGVSYAYLDYLRRLRSQRPGSDVRRELSQHAGLFHISELRELTSKGGDIPVGVQALVQLPWEYGDLLMGAPRFAAGKNWVFYRSAFFGAAELIYSVYPRKELELYLRDGPYRISSGTTGCLFEGVPECWVYSFSHLVGIAQDAHLIMLGLSILVTLSLVILILARIFRNRREDERRRLALQVLTHEFRTPIASMLLTTEGLSRNMDRFSDDDQEDILRLTSDLYRLKRLSETSRHYLRYEEGRKHIELNVSEIDSLTNLMEELCSPYFEEVELIAPDSDFSVETDVYWLEIILKNLIENVIHHGQAPIQVRWWQSSAGQYRIEVKDQGICSFKTLKDLTSAFVKGAKSEGSGLGMNIVAKVVRQLKGDLKFNPAPTTFTLCLRRKL